MKNRKHNLLLITCLLLALTVTGCQTKTSGESTTTSPAGESTTTKTDETTGAIDETTGAADETTEATDETTGAIDETTGAESETTKAADDEAAIAEAVAAAKYDPRPDGTSRVRDQYWGTCWAQAGISTLESFVINKGLEDNSIQFSVEDVLWWAFNNGWSLKRRSDGGFSQTTLGYFMTVGARSEEDIPYFGKPTEGDNEDHDHYMTGENQQPANYDTAPVMYEVTDIVFTDDYSAENIKEMIVRYGAVSTVCRSTEESFNSETSADYNPYIEGEEANHYVSVIGWDDAFSKDNFLAVNGQTPQNDGAWIVKNSYGTEYGSDGGFIYISYDDGYLFKRDVDSSRTYSIAGVRKPTDRKCYMVDKLGAINYITEDTEDTGVWANVFDFGADERINELSFVSWSKGGTYKLYYAPLDNDIPVTDSSKWVLLSEGKIENAGYMTVSSDYADAVPEGKGAIVISISGDTPSIGTEEPFYQSGRSVGNPSFDEASYVLENGVFTAPTVSRTNEDTPYETKVDFCIRAYTVPVSK